MSAVPTFRVISSVSSNFLVVETVSGSGAKNLVWMDSDKYTEEWKEQKRSEILKKESLKSPLVIPVSKTKNDEPYTSDHYETDSEDEIVDEEAEFDSQWMPKVDLKQYEPPKHQWIKVAYKKRASSSTEN